MNIKQRGALIALALGLIAGGVAAPTLVSVSGNAGAGGGDVHAGQAAPAVAGSKGDQFSGRESNIAGSRAETAFGRESS